MKRMLLALLVCAVAAYAQFGTARRLQSGASLPSSCAVGDVFYKTGASAGQYNCTATNTWTLAAGTTAGVGGGA